MSLLKKLKKKQKTSSEIMIKSGTVVVLETQEEFNQLAELFGSLDEDSIIIDAPYVAYMDSYPALVVTPITEFAEDIDNFLEACKHKNLKPIEFSTWKRKIKVIRIHE